MILENTYLCLRPYLFEDWQSIHIYSKDLHFSRFEVWGPNTEQDTQNFVQECIKKNTLTPQYEYEFAIIKKETSELIGGCSFRKACEKSQVANFGYSINPKFQNQGFATQATLIMLDFAFLKLDIEVVYALSHCDNVASYTVMEKCKMKRVGRVPNYLKLKTGLADVYRYEMNKAEFLKFNK